MKELEQKTKDQVENVRQVQQKKQKVFLGTMLPGDGHKLYELDHKDLTMRVVKKTEVDKTANFEQVKKKPLNPGEVYIPHDANRKQFKSREGCSYLYALNDKSAAKKFMKRLGVPKIAVIIDEQPTGHK